MQISSKIVRFFLDNSVKQKVKIGVILFFLCGSVFVVTRKGRMVSAQSQSDQRQMGHAKSASEVYKNIQALKEMPADQLDRVMAIFTGALGVRCSFCHIPNQYEKDDKEEKRTAREMIRMVFAINKGNFGGRSKISCATCHGGRPLPSSIPLLGQNVFLSPVPKSNQVNKETLPTVDQVLDKYATALGGKMAIEKIRTRVEKGSRIGADGIAVPEEIYQEFPGKISVTTAYSKEALTTVSDGTKVWTVKGNQMDSDQAEQFKLEAYVGDPTHLKDIYREMFVEGTDKIGDTDVYVVSAMTRIGKQERFYFDKQTGLLVRRFAAWPTVIGIYPFQVDYSDYRAVDGVQIPLAIQWSIPGRVWSRKITDVKQNTVIDEAKFKQPVN